MRAHGVYEQNIFIKFQTLCLIFLIINIVIIKQRFEEKKI